METACICVCQHATLQRKTNGRLQPIHAKTVNALLGGLMVVAHASAFQTRSFSHKHSHFASIVRLEKREVLYFRHYRGKWVSTKLPPWQLCCRRNVARPPVPPYHQLHKCVRSFYVEYLAFFCYHSYLWIYSFSFFFCYFKGAFSTIAFVSHTALVHYGFSSCRLCSVGVLRRKWQSTALTTLVW